MTKRFGDRDVFTNLDLDIAARSAVALIGANGTGKSTLLRCLIRLVEPTAGTVTVLGESVGGLTGFRLKALRARVGMVFQRHNLVPRLSALSNVVHGVQARDSGWRTWAQGLARDEVRHEAMSCLDAVGLADKALQRADSLSGGQSQRVAIARTLMQRPEIILADEPDASLDPKSGRDVMAMLLELSKRKGLTLLTVSHRMEHAIAYSDRIVGLQSGTIALDAASHAVDAGRLGAFFSEQA